ncbi:MAG: HEAT repeat domain-containing protein [Bacillota bacterium]|nr:HEAT repeat domain-containing protein [Bacillota bacterium]
MAGVLDGSRSPLGEFFYNLSHLGILYERDPSGFWTYIAILGLVMVLLFLFLVFAVLNIKKKQKSTLKDSSARTFIDIEKPEEDSGNGAILLPLPEKIISCGQQLNRETARRILLKAPQSLADVVTAYERCSLGVQNSLAQLVRESRMLESYSLHLNEDGFPLGVLVDAWKIFPDSNTLRTFVEFLANQDAQIQMNGVRILSAIREPKSLSLLVPALVRPGRYVTARVAEVFLSMPNQSAALLAYMLPEVEEPQKLLMLEIIAQAAVEFPTENVLACLKSKNPQVRAAACLALGSGQMVSPVPQLILAANDRQWQVRAAAAKALGQIGDMRGFPTLQSLLGDQEGWVAAAAREALAVYDDFSTENF